MRVAVLLALVAPAFAFHAGLQRQRPLLQRQRPLSAYRTRDAVCGWGPDPVWKANVIETIVDAASGLKAVTIAPPAGAASEYTIPGQYVQIREPGAEKAAFFALASPPGASGSFEFLIKEQPASEWSPGTGWLTGAAAGAALDMSQPMGGGFDLKAIAEVDHVLLFAAGSGISPIRSAIESGALAGKKTTLYYGASTAARMSYSDKFAVTANIEPGLFAVLPCSRPARLVSTRSSPDLRSIPGGRRGRRPAARSCRSSRRTACRTSRRRRACRARSARSC